MLGNLVERGHQARESGLARTTLNAFVLALFAKTLKRLAHHADGLATEEGRDTHVATWAHEAAARAADGAAWADGLGVHLTWTHGALLACVRTLGAHHLRADGGGHARLRVGDGADSSAWALHVVRLGVVHSAALVGLGHVLALGRHVNNALLGVQELGWRFGDGGTTTGHFVLLKEKLITLSTSTCSHILGT